jgi:hypothetical protein
MKVKNAKNVYEFLIKKLEDKLYSLEEYNDEQELTQEELNYYYELKENQQ